MKKKSVMMKASGMCTCHGGHNECIVLNCAQCLASCMVSFFSLHAKDLPAVLITSSWVKKHTWCIVKWKIQRAAKEAGP